MKNFITSKESDSTSDIDGGPTILTTYYLFGCLPFWMESELA